ncbi:MAG: zinc ribbon domain-containing protein [Candidatus Aramenus sp.]|jgi:hypothetical protein|nr:zinc ribbon domain-containing protein [Candidatus Aramenus sp.]
MQKTYSGRNVNLQALAQEINNLLLSEGWESTMQPMAPPMGGMQDFLIRAIKKGHFHHAEQVIVRVTGYPYDFRIIVEEEHIGPLGRELVNHRLFTQIDKEINDGLFDLPYQATQYQPAPQYPQPAQPQQGVKCPQCGFVNPPTSKFCANCGYRLA